MLIYKLTLSYYLQVMILKHLWLSSWKPDKKNWKCSALIFLWSPEISNKRCESGSGWGIKPGTPSVNSMLTVIVLHTLGILILDLRWKKRGWVANGPDFEWDQIHESPTIWNPGKWVPFCQKHLKFRQKCSFFNWVGPEPMLDNLKSDLQKVEILSPHCIYVTDKRSKREPWLLRHG